MNHNFDTGLLCPALRSVTGQYAKSATLKDMVILSYRTYIGV
ncbi:MAG: hypothetical protein P8185_09800 [Deltaproteobacteria bacterium]